MSGYQQHHGSQRPQGFRIQFVTLHTQNILLCHSCLRAVAITSSPSDAEDNTRTRTRDVYQRFLRVTFCGICRRNHHERFRTEDSARREDTHDGLVLPFSHKMQEAVGIICDVLSIKDQEICIIGGRSGMVACGVERCMEFAGGGGVKARWLESRGEVSPSQFWEVSSRRRERERRDDGRMPRRGGEKPEYMFEDEYDVETDADHRGTPRGNYGGTSAGRGYPKPEYFYDEE